MEEIKCLENKKIAVEKVEEIKIKPSALELFITNTITTLNSITHQADIRLSLNGSFEYLKSRYSKYLDDLEEPDTDEEHKLLDEEDYIETIIKDDGAYKDKDEIDAFLESLDSRELISDICYYLNNSTARLNPKNPYERKNMIKFIDLKHKLKTILEE